MYQGSFQQIGDNEIALVTQVGSDGNPLSGFDSSRPATAVLSQLAFVDLNSHVLLAANPARRSWKAVNTSNKIIYFAYGAVAAVGAFTDQIAPGGSYESKLNDYTGVISVIFSAAANANKIMVTEVTT